MTTTATSAAPSATADTCDAKRAACGAVYLANQSLCAVQKNACDACEAAYESYITSPNSNKAYAAAFRAQCFSASTVDAGESVGPLISSLSIAQAGTPATSTSAASTAPAEPRTTATYVLPPSPLTTTVLSQPALPTSTLTSVPLTTFTSVPSGTAPGVSKTSTIPLPTTTGITFNGAAGAIRPEAFGVFAIVAALFFI